MAVGGVECRPEGEQFVEREAEGEDVAAGVGVTVELFGGHVPQRAEDVAGVRQVLLVGRLGEAEVGDPDAAAGVEQQVAGLHVAMDDALLVGVVEGLGRLHADAGHALEVDVPPAVTAGFGLARQHDRTGEP